MSKNQFYRMTYEQALVDYRDGYMSVKGLIITVLRTKLWMDGQRLTVNSVEDFCNDIGISESAYYKAINELGVAEKIGWKATGSMSFWLGTGAPKKSTKKGGKKPSTNVEMNSSNVESDSTNVEWNSPNVESDSTNVESETLHPVQVLGSSSPQINTDQYRFNSDQYPLNPPKETQEKEGGKAIKVEVEVLEKEQKPAISLTAPSDQKLSPLTALTICEDKERSAAAPTVMQQEIPVFPTAVASSVVPTDYVSGAELMERRFRGDLHPWEIRTPEGRKVVDEGFVEFMAKAMPKGTMPPMDMAHSHIINASRSQSTLMKIERKWDKYQAALDGNPQIEDFISKADRKHLDLYNAMNVLAAKYGSVAS